jgi:molybdate transport system substrate-binding protein
MMETFFNKISMVIGLILVSFTLISCGSSPAREQTELTISAAASLTDALKEIQKAFELKYNHIKLNYNLGSSGALQQQIQQGAPVDVFLSASTKHMNVLVQQQWIQEDQQINVLSNEIAMIVPIDSKLIIENSEDLTREDIKKIAIGIPESVPAGNYAKEALINAKLWEPLQQKLVQAKDVRQVLHYVETGNADAGFVYKSDVLSSSKVKIAYVLDPKTYAAVEYPFGIVKSTQHREEAEKFYTFIQTKEALNIFVKYGFTITASEVVIP